MAINPNSLTKSSMPSKPSILKVAEFFVGAWIILTILLIGSDFTSSSNDSQDDPFTSYRHNPGIIRISIATFIARLLFVGCLIIFNIKPQYKGRFLAYAFFFSGLMAAFLQWYELYYGSTFYYGEIRDKQGLMFPLLASSVITLMIWECSFWPNEDRDLRLKMILTAIVNLALYVLWLNVAEPWNLIQS